MPLPAGVAAFGPSVLSGLASWFGGEQANRRQREAAREQMAFQERMSNTSYQRAVHDMRMAGINPMLAYAQGGASSPGGAQPDINDTLGPAVSSAQHGSRLSAELRNMRSQDLLLQAQSQQASAAAQHSWSAKALNDGALAGMGFRVGRLGEIEPIAPSQYGLEARKRLYDLAFPQAKYDATEFLREAPKMFMGGMKFLGEGARRVRDFGKRAEEMAKPWNLFDRAARWTEGFIGPQPGGR